MDRVKVFARYSTLAILVLVLSGLISVVIPVDRARNVAPRGSNGIASVEVGLSPSSVIANGILAEVSHTAWAQTAKILHVAEDTLPVSLNPLTATSMVEVRTIELIHDGPFKKGEGGRPEASLIELDPKTRQPRFSLSSSHMEAEGWLAKASFHNGRPVSVADLKATLLAYAAAVERYRPGEFFLNLIKDVRSMTDDAERHFAIDFQRRLDNPRYALNIKVLPRTGFASPDDPSSYPEDAGYASKPIGAGPFFVAQAYNPKTDSRLLLKAHTTYRQTGPKLNGIEIIGVPTAVEKLSMLRSGQVEVVVSLSREDQARARSYKAETRSYPLRNWWYLGFNFASTSAPLANKEVRQALRMMVDRHALGRKIGEVLEYGGQAIQDAEMPIQDSSAGASAEASVILVTGPFVPQSPFYNRSVAHPQLDPAEGKRRLLASGKFTQKDGKIYLGVRQLTLELAVDRYLPDAEDIAAQITQDFLDQGIKINATLLGGAEWERRVQPVDGSRGGQFDLVLGRWAFDFQDDISTIFATGAKRNYYRYSNTQVDDLLKRADVEPDPDQRSLLLQQVHALLADDVPCVFLWQAQQVAAFSPRVRGYGIHSFSFYINPHLWDLDK